MGVIFAFLAMMAWGVGDFLIQRSTRKFGNSIALFCITAFAAVALFPWVMDDLPSLFTLDYRFWLLMGASVIMLFAALFDFEALREGKISVVEPVYALEVPIAVGLSSFLLAEWLSGTQWLLIVALVVSICLVSLKSLHILRSFRIEKGVLLAGVATLGMGTSNFLFGVGSRVTDPLMTNWFVSAFVAVVMALHLTQTGKWSVLAQRWKTQKSLMLSVSVIDNIAWIAYSYSTLTIPIGIATAISESYIAVAALLGLVWNKEKLVIHQKIALVSAIVLVIILGWTSEQ
ncbi:MAG: DMT family transporter [Patescibacteria group bacterium]